MKPRRRRILWAALITTISLALWWSEHDRQSAVHYWSRDICDITGSTRERTFYRDGRTTAAIHPSALESEARRRQIPVAHDWHEIESRYPSSGGAQWHTLAAYLDPSVSFISPARAAAMSNDEIRRLVQPIASRDHDVARSD